MKKYLLLLLALLLILGTGCVGKSGPEETEYVLYFLSDGEISHGPALTSQPYEGEEENPDAGDLMDALLSGPTGGKVRSPFPRGLTLQDWELDPEQPGNLRLRLSEQYGGLTDISLTLADYCIVLTLSQLEEVTSVEILSGGYTASYRSHQRLLPEEAVLWDEMAEQN